MPEYTYRFADLLTDADVVELELSDVKFDRRINQAGAFSATIVVSNSEVAEQVKKVVPAKTIVHVYRDSEIWGSYIIWTMNISSSSHGPVKVDFQGASLESWLEKRIIDTDLTFTGVDQFDIARALIDNAQLGWTPYETASHLGIEYNLDDSGILRDRNYYLTDAASVGQRLRELANVDNGFEFMINTYEDNGIRHRIFLIYSQMGYEENDAIFTYPGNINSYELTYDATSSATAWWTRGDTIDDDITATSAPLMTPIPSLSDLWLSNGYPHLDRVVDYTSVTVLTTLEDYAAWWRDNHSGFIAIPVITISTNSLNTIITPTTLGSYADFTIEDEFFALGEFSSRNRIIGIEVSPPQRGRQESIRLVIETAIDPTDI